MGIGSLCLRLVISFEVLSSCTETGSEALGKVRIANRLLRGGYVVGNAMQGDALDGGVVDGEGCAPVAIARLAHGAWVVGVAGARGDVHRELFRLVLRVVKRADFLPL